MAVKPLIRPHKIQYYEFTRFKNSSSLGRETYDMILCVLYASASFLFISLDFVTPCGFMFH